MESSAQVPVKQAVTTWNNFLLQLADLSFELQLESLSELLSWKHNHIYNLIKIWSSLS